MYFPETNPVYSSVYLISRICHVPHLDWRMGSNLPVSDTRAEVSAKTMIFEGANQSLLQHVPDKMQQFH